jgi:hypothetical protein
MIAVIQSAESRHPRAGHLTARNGQRVLFVADPTQAPAEPGVCHARPDDVSSFGVSWRKLVQTYNANPRNNPLGLLPAHQLYADPVHARLVEALGEQNTYILSAGWGLVRSSFLLPNYDISLSPGADRFRRREASASFADFRMLPDTGEADLYLFADADHLALFCRLTASWPGRRIVCYAGAEPPSAPGCELRRFEGATGANGYRECARAFLATRPDRQSDLGNDKATPKVSNIESRLRAAMKKFPGASPSLLGGGPEPDPQTIRAAVRSARGPLAEYLWLMRTLREVDVTDHPEFQTRFNAFYRISQRSQAWHAAYYKLLEISKFVGAEFADVLDELWEETGRYEPAYASRLVATVDPGQPVWDRFALMHAGLRAPAYLDPDKLENAAKVYRQIREWYAAYLESSAGRRIVELFDEAAPDYATLGARTKIEFVLRHTHVESPAFTPPNQTAASLSQRA